MAFVVDIDKNDKVRDEDVDHDGAAAPNPERVIGWAIWTRHGTDVAATRWQSINLGPGTKVEFALQLIQTRLLELVNPLIDHEHMKAVSHMMQSDFDHKKYHDYWQLEGCYVDPDWQRRGAGRLALGWGMKQAQAENVPILMKASPKGVELYEKAGFMKVEKEDFTSHFETGGQGYWKMVWWPKP